MTPEEQRQMRPYELNAIEQDRQIVELSNENERLSSLVESLRMVVVRWNGSCSSSRQVEDTEDCIAGWNKRASNFAAERDSLRSDLAKSDSFRERLAMKHRRLNDSHSQLKQLYNQQLEITERVRSLLVQAVGLLRDAEKSLQHMQMCQSCGESDWSDCGGGIEALEVLSRTAALLALPQIAEMKEGKA